jgi:biopolymer transport protein ExbD
MIGRARRRRKDGDDDVNVTAFMNLMVILVPFLLITAVFSRLTILELNLPAAESEATQTEQLLNIEVIVRKDQIQITDRGTGLLQALPNVDGGYDLKGLTTYLQLVKQKYPQKTDATVLLESDTNYDTVVQVMDAVRAITVEVGGKSIQAALFPDISIGDAPEAAPLPAPVAATPAAVGGAS